MTPAQETLVQNAVDLMIEKYGPRARSRGEGMIVKGVASRQLDYLWRAVLRLGLVPEECALDVLRSLWAIRSEFPVTGESYASPKWILQVRTAVQERL